jgi:hypothetical protein
VIDAFAASNIPIRTIERSSGFIATERLSVADPDTTWADCGRDPMGRLFPDWATYNVVVRGDSIRSTVLVTVKWQITPTHGLGPDCVTRANWESGMERAIKKRAEQT